MKFDLFKLHDEKQDIASRGWIRIGGIKLMNEVRLILIETLSKGYSLLQIAKIIADQLGISYHTVYNYLKQIKNDKWHNRNKNYIPIPILDLLIRLWNLERYKEEKWKLIKLIDNLVTGAPKSKPVRALKKLIPELAKIAGTHAADGTLARSKTAKNSFMYMWRVTDRDETSIKILQEWLNICFDVFVTVEKSKNKNSFELSVNNKVIFRYLNKILGFKIGSKTLSVSMPEIIKNSTKEMRRCFAVGVLTFDGSVDMDGKLRLNIKSKSLFKDIEDIMKEDRIKLTFPEKEDRIRGPSFRCKITENGEKALNYLAIGSVKWKKAKGFLFGFEEENVFELFKRIPINKITLFEVLETGIEFGTFNNQILMKALNVSSRTVRKYKNILRLSRILID